MLVQMFVVFVQLASKTHLYFQLKHFFFLKFTITDVYSSNRKRQRNRYDSTTFSHPWDNFTSNRIVINLGLIKCN